jgi:hypothetical protein
MPFIGVADQETAEDGLERLCGETLHVEPGPYEFLDTLYLDGRRRRAVHRQRLHLRRLAGVSPATPGHLRRRRLGAAGRPGGLDLVPEVRDWLLAAERGRSRRLGPRVRAGAAPATCSPTPAATCSPPTRRSPMRTRAEALEGGWSPLDVLAHAVDVEAYYVAEARRGLGQPGRMWRCSTAPSGRTSTASCGRRTTRRHPRPHGRRPRETRPGLTSAARALAATSTTPSAAWCRSASAIEKIARHDREHAEQLRRMSQAAALLRAPSWAQASRHARGPRRT